MMYPNTCPQDGDDVAREDTWGEALKAGMW